MTAGKSKRDPPAELATVIHRVRREISEAHLKLLLFEQLYAHSDERTILLGNTAGTFFTVVFNALLESLTMSLARLVDERHTVSLSMLVAMAKGSLEHKTYDKAKETLDEIKALCRTIDTRRNKLYAHLDPELGLKSGHIDLGPLSRKEIKDILQKMGQLLNLIREDFGMPYIVLDAIPANDAESLIRAIEGD